MLWLLCFLQRTKSLWNSFPAHSNARVSFWNVLTCVDVLKESAWAVTSFFLSLNSTLIPHLKELAETQLFSQSEDAVIPSFPPSWTGSRQENKLYFQICCRALKPALNLITFCRLKSVISRKNHFIWIKTELSAGIWHSCSFHLCCSELCGRFSKFQIKSGHI